MKMQFPLKHDLKEPIEFGSEIIKHFEIRRMTAKEIRGMKGTQSSDLLDLLGQLTGQPDVVIDKLGMEDTMDLLEIVGSFFERGQKIGKKF